MLTLVGIHSQSIGVAFVVILAPNGTIKISKVIFG